jgi:hypothetical protein
VAQGLNRYAVIDPSCRFATPRSGAGPVLQFVTVVANRAARHRVNAHASIEQGLKRRIGRQPSGGRRQLPCVVESFPQNGDGFKVKMHRLLGHNNLSHLQTVFGYILARINGQQSDNWMTLA